MKSRSSGDLNLVIFFHYNKFFENYPRISQVSLMLVASFFHADYDMRNPEDVICGKAISGESFQSLRDDAYVCFNGTAVKTSGGSPILGSRE